MLGVDDAVDAVFEEGVIEVDEEAELLLSVSEVGEKLGSVDGKNGFDYFEFYDEGFLGKNVDSIGVGNGEAFVVERKGDFAAAGNFPEFEFMSECSLITRF